jgi:hypothetical protein
VTVNPPGPNSPAGTIASGLIGTKPWNLRIESPGTKKCQVTGNGLGRFDCSGGGLPQVDAADPVAFGGMGGSDKPDLSGPETFFVSYGAVRKDVASVRVVLANGTVLTPRPVTLDGERRWVAFANPVGVPVASVTAYSRSGEIATAIPFNGPSGAREPDISAWLRPGQAGAARLTKTIASGTADGQAWRLTAYIGPWGTCLEGGNGGVCYAATTYAAGDTSEIGAADMSPSGTLVFGAAASSVSYLIVTPKNEAAIRVGVTEVGQQKYFAFHLNRWPTNDDRWTAYNFAGQPVASGSLS